MHDTHVQGVIPADLRPGQPVAGVAPRPVGGKRKWASVASFEVNLEQNLWALHDELRDKTYSPGPYRHFTIAKPKLRRISAAPFGSGGPPCALQVTGQSSRRA